MNRLAEEAFDHESPTISSPPTKKIRSNNGIGGKIMTPRNEKWGCITVPMLFEDRVEQFIVHATPTTNNTTTTSHTSENIIPTEEEEQQQEMYIIDCDDENDDELIHNLGSSSSSTSSPGGTLLLRCHHDDNDTNSPTFAYIKSSSSL